MLTYEQISPYLKYSNPDQIPNDLKHEYYDATKKYRESLESIFGEAYPDYLDKSRPRERKSDKAYRKNIYKNTWEHLPDRVEETLDYIHQADDFDVSFPPLPEGLSNEEDSLEAYTGSSFTPDGSLTNWFFNNCLKPYLLDPNSVSAMVLNELPQMDKNFNTKGFFNPVPMVFPSEFVIAHQKGRFAVLESPEKRKYVDEAGKQKEGRILHFFDDESYCAAFEVGENKLDGGGTQIYWTVLGLTIEKTLNEEGFTEEINLKPIEHHFNSMPVYKLGKRLKKKNHKREEFYKSILDGAKPKIKESQQTQSDVEVERNVHVSSSEWLKKSAIPKCSHPGCVAGVIYEKDASGNEILPKPCPTCKGTGINPSSGSGLEVVMVNDDVEAGGFGSNEKANKSASGAPGGYIEKSIDPIKQLTSDLKDSTAEVYEILNMRFIKSAPNEASGTSKRYDREELYRELNTQAAHLLDLLKNHFDQADHIRYTLFPTYVGMQSPTILVPVRFNLENAELTREELNDAKEKKYDPSIISVLEKKLLEYNVGKNASEYQEYETRVELNPFRNMNDDQKNMTIGIMRMLIPEGEQLNRMIGEFVFSIILDSLIVRAKLENDDFYSWDMKQRNKKLRSYLPEYFSEVRDIPMEVDPLTGMPKMPQFALKPGVNIQDTNQTNQGAQSDGIFKR